MADQRRTGSSLAFTVALVAGEVAVYRLAPSGDVALAAGAAWIVLLLLVVAAGDLAVMTIGRSSRLLAWLPEWPLPAWLNPVRSSFLAVAFLYGILLGHFFWR
jgi:hypothetical protein